MVLSLYGGFGVDKKTNKLLKKETKLEDSLNMTLDDQKNWTKRKGQAIKFPASVSDAVYMNADLNFTPGIPAYHNKPGRYFATTSTGYKVFNQDGSEFVPHNFSGLTNTSEISEGEYMETLLFTHVENPQAVLKYDGGSIYRAGLPNLTITNVTSPGSAYDWLIFMDYMDAYGNSIYGPARTYSTSSINGGVTYNTLKNTGFYEGFLKIAQSGSTIQTLSSVNNTLINVSSYSADYKVGARVCFRNGSAFAGSTKVEINNSLPDSALQFVSLRIIAITATTITFDSSDFGQNTIKITSPIGTSRNIDFRNQVRVYVKPSSSSVYSRWSGVSIPMDNSSTLDGGAPAGDSVVSSDTLSEVYDLTTSKLRPPQCKYIQVFGDQVAYGSVSGLWDFENRFIKYNNDDIIMYSDISEGDYGENISEINRQLIGDTYDGNISGMCRVKDSLIVFKNKSLYAIDGVLLPGEYSLRKIESNLIGCISHKSIITTEQYALFQGNDNIYVTNAFSIKPFGEDIKQDIDSSTKMRSAIVVPMEGYIFWNNTKTFFFNYDHNEWFIWDNVDASSGMVIDNEGNPICFSGTNCTEFIDDRNDLGAPIVGNIQLSFLHMKKPGLLKKLTGVRLFNIGTTGNIIMTVMKEWSSAVMSTSTLDYSTSPVSVHKTISPIIGQSISVKFENSIVDENMLISGIDLEIDLNQYKDKNVN